MYVAEIRTWMASGVAITDRITRTNELASSYIRDFERNERE